MNSRQKVKVSISLTMRSIVSDIPLRRNEILCPSAVQKLPIAGSSFYEDESKRFHVGRNDCIHEFLDNETNYPSPKAV